MLAIHESSADRAHRQGADFEGSLELLRELAVTTDVEQALPRLSAIVGKMLPHDALRLACFDDRGRLVVNVATADVPDVTASEIDELVIDDLESEDDYRSALGVSTSSPEPLISLVFWSKPPLAFNRAQMPLARWIAYHFGLGPSFRDLGRAGSPPDGAAAPRRRGGATGPRATAVRPARRGRVPGMARGAAQGHTGRRHRHHCPDHRRVRNRKGDRGTIHPCHVRAEGRAVRGASTAPRSPRRCSRASCSVTSAAPSRARSREGRPLRGGRRRHAVPRRGGRDPARRCRRSSCASCRSASSSASAARGRSKVDVRIIAATNRDLRADGRSAARSARTSTTGWTCSPSALPPLRERRDGRSAARRATSCSELARRMRATAPCIAARDALRCAACATTGPGTCASCATRSSAPSSWPTAAS